MIIIIDGRPLCAIAAGIANFLEGSLHAWAEKRPDDIFLVALPKSIHNTINIKHYPPNIQFKEYSNSFSRRLPNIIWLCIIMPWITRKLNAGIYYSSLPCIPFFLPRSIKKIIVVHDVVNLEYKNTMQWTNILSNKLFFSRSIKKADVIWSNSLYTKDKIEHYFPKRKCKEIFTGASVDRNIYHNIEISEKEIEALKLKYNIIHPFIIFVGSLEPRKNLSFLLSIMPMIYKRKHIQLVVVGGKGWKNSIIRNIVEDKDFPKESTVFCGFVPDEDLVRLYHMAECLVSTSLNEGFGMPQLEALLCGCPIVTAHNSAMIEVADRKSGASSVIGYDRNKWIETILKVIEEHPKVNVEQLSEYDWGIIIKKLLKSKL